MSNTPDRSELMSLTADIVAAHVSHNSVTPETLLAMISSVYNTLSTVGTVPEVAERPVPAVPVKRSVFPDHIVCLEDGKKLKMLKRHLQTAYNLTPEQYRERWGLGPDYPMVAPDYAAKRSSLAKSIGLGRKASVAVAEEPEIEDEPEAPPPKATRGRKKAIA
jgi:predicted transcriptional regulator